MYRIDGTLVDTVGGLGRLPVMNPQLEGNTAHGALVLLSIQRKVHLRFLPCPDSQLQAGSNL